MIPVYTCQRLDLNFNNNERDLFNALLRTSTNTDRDRIYLHILPIFIGYHHFYNKVLDMRWNRLLADMLHQFAELHW